MSASSTSYPSFADLADISSLEFTASLPQDATIFTETTDAPFSLGTPYTIAVGDTFNGTLATGADEDLIAITVVAGETYTFDLTSATADMYMRIYDAAGDYLTLDDDSGTGSNSSMTLTFATGGTYYIAASDFDGSGSGSYSLSVSSGTALPVYTHDQIAAQLTDGYWDNTARATRHFDVTNGGSLDVDISGLTADGQFLATAALQAWTFVTGIAFNVVVGSADITFDDNASGAYSTSSTTGSIIDSSEVNVSTAWLASNGTTLDSYSFQTYIHEIGHALGLGHAGNYNGSAYYGNDNHYQNDSWLATVMSYMNQTTNTAVTASYGYILTPMIADIIAIQNLYGTNSNQRTGDTTYGENSNAGGYYDDYTSLSTNPLAITIMDDGGTDTIDLRSDVTNQIIDMHGESTSTVYGQIAGISIARGTTIERFRAGTGNDFIDGNNADNKIWGNDGNDEIIGGGGKDTIYGQNNGDVLRGGGGKDKLYGGGGKDDLWGNDGADLLKGGSKGDDLRGGGGNDTLKGESGGDVLRGERGNDKLYGGSGGDKFVFQNNYDRDTIYDFADNVDTIKLNDNLWSGVKSVAQVLTDHATLINGGADVFFDFGGGDTLTVRGVSTINDLLDDITIF